MRLFVLQAGDSTIRSAMRVMGEVAGASLCHGPAGAAGVGSVPYPDGTELGATTTDNVSGGAWASG
jgi:hypothetical protein